MKNSHKAIIKGNVYRRTYMFSCLNWDKEPRIEIHEGRFVREETIWEGEIDLPIMKDGDKIYIIDLDLTVTIKDCLRTTDNKFIYSTYHKAEVIEDEETEETKLRAEMAEKYYLEDNKETYRPWYKRLFRG